MIHYIKLKEWLSWPLVRAHLCTVAVAVGSNSTWRVPREALRYGGVSYLLALTVAMIAVALPATLLQLAVGQLSQQDAVGVWRAVPFFKGVGYMRLLISYIASVYTIIYLALTTTYFLYTISNSVPVWDCTNAIKKSGNPEKYEDIFTYSKSTCLNSTFLAPITEEPEYYIAISMVTIVLWIIFPFIFYNPVKFMKRILYALGPPVILLLIVIPSRIGSQSNLSDMQTRSEWRHYLETKIWHSAVTQALLSSQVSGGFLISSGDSIYSSTNVQWTSIVFVGANVLSSWVGVIFWFGVAGGARDRSVVAVLVQMFKAVEDQDLNSTWPLLVFATLFCSGFVSMLTLLYPLYDHFRRVYGPGWRVVAFSSSVLGAVAALGVLAGRLPALTVLDDTAVPFLLSIATILEMVAFVFIYGWKPLVEDVEFLTGRTLVKYWVMGWCAAPGITLLFTAWWLVRLFLDTADWTEAPWEAIAISVCAAVAFLIFVGFATMSVVKQVQYDFIAKIKSSFKPLRHWGPRDPITHYYWLAHREEVGRGHLPSRYSRRQLGQLSGGASFLNISQHIESTTKKYASKKRSKSDDWLYTGKRKEYLAEVFRSCIQDGKRRSKSLDSRVGDHVVTRNNRTIGHTDSVQSCNYVTTPELAVSVENNAHEDINIKLKKDEVF